MSLEELDFEIQNYITYIQLCKEQYLPNEYIQPYRDKLKELMIEKYKMLDKNINE